MKFLKKVYEGLTALMQFPYIKLIGGLIIIPLFLDKIIFSNEYVSAVSNDGWAGFFGGYLGALVGAFATIYAVKKQIVYNEQIRKEDEVLNIRPYLSMQDTNYDLHGAGLMIKAKIYNYGKHAACNILILDGQRSNENALEHEIIWAKNSSIGPMGFIEVEFIIKTFDNNKFLFYDILGNSYTQEIKVHSSETKEVEYLWTDQPIMYVKRETVLPKRLYEV